MTFIKQYLNAIIAFGLLALIVAGFFGVRSYNESLREQGRAEIRAEAQAAENAALREDRREISRLTETNQVIQDELTSISLAASDLERDRAIALGLRDKAARAAAIAGASADALRNHATRAESDIDRSDADTERFGLEAVRAASVAHALNATLQARRAEIDAYRETLRTKETK